MQDQFETQFAPRLGEFLRGGLLDLHLIVSEVADHSLDFFNVIYRPIRVVFVAILPGPRLAFPGGQQQLDRCSFSGMLFKSTDFSSPEHPHFLCSQGFHEFHEALGLSRSDRLQGLLELILRISEQPGFLFQRILRTCQAFNGGALFAAWESFSEMMLLSPGLNGEM